MSEPTAAPPDGLGLADAIGLLRDELQLGGGGARAHGSEQKMTVVFGGPVDRAGNPVKVAQPSRERKG
jgi:hypothetical protein